MPILPSDLAEFESKQVAFEASRTGRWTLGSIPRIRDTDLTSVLLADGKLLRDIGRVNSWAARFPTDIARSPDFEFIDFGPMSDLDAGRAILETLSVISTLTHAKLLQGPSAAGLDADDIIRLAGGVDAASHRLRDPLVPPIDDDAADLLKGLLRPKLSDLLGGALSKHFNAYGRGAAWAANQRAAASRLGKIVSISPGATSPGSAVKIELIDLGSTAPDPGSRIVVRFPARSSQGRRRVVEVEVPASEPFRTGWQDVNTLTVVVPPEAVTGYLSLRLYVPSSDSSYTPGELVATAEEVAFIFGESFGPAGVFFGNELRERSISIDQTLLSPVPEEPKPQGDGHDLLVTGAPIIEAFASPDGDAFVHPRGTIRLSWQLANVQSVTVVAEDIDGQNELPPVSISPPAPVDGVPVTDFGNEITMTVPCTRRWRGRYRMIAENGSAASPAEAEIAFDSGFAPFRVGAARHPLYMTEVGRPFFGYEYNGQKASDDLDEGPAGTTNRNHQYARAFIIEEDDADPNRQSLVIVVCDLMSISPAIRRAVLARFGQSPRLKRFVDPGAGRRGGSLMLCATHTHSTCGGYSDFGLYGYTAGGYDTQVVMWITNAIFNAVYRADQALTAGRVSYGASTVKGCGLIRSLPAFRANVPEASEARYAPVDGAGNIDPGSTMTVLRLEATQADGTWRDIGALSLFALHPTNLGVLNTTTSGDNKGWAALRLEQEMIKRPTTSKDFVAAFANGACGDISPNIEFGGPPQGGPERPDLLDVDRKNMRDMGERQCQAALAILGQQMQELSLPLACGYRNIEISKIRDPAGSRLTHPAAVGISFAAGSSEDSIPFVDALGARAQSYVQEGVTVANLIAELARPAPAPAGIAFLAVLAGWPRTVGLQVSLAEQAIAADRICGDLKTPAGASVAVVLPKSSAVPPVRVGVVNVPRVAMSLSDEIAHYPKPILFAVGYAKVGNLTLPLVPAAVPIQMMRIGDLAIIGVPAEITTIAGKRLEATVSGAMGGIPAVIAGYANSYSGYITTLEEYGAQDYEGASTLYGPGTLRAYQQEFAKLAGDVFAGAGPDDQTEPPPAATCYYQVP